MQIKCIFSVFNSVKLNWIKIRPANNKTHFVLKCIDGNEKNHDSNNLNTEISTPCLISVYVFISLMIFLSRSAAHIQKCEMLYICTS